MGAVTCITYELKTWPEPFQAVWEGRKRYEIRKNDRGFGVGDHLVLREFKPHAKCGGSGWDLGFENSAPCGCAEPHGQYTGRKFHAQISYMTQGGQWGLPENLCVLSLEKERRAVRRPKVRRKKAARTSR